MRILWLTWKDRHHPFAGGGEVVQHELAKRLSEDGHEVTFVVPSYEGAPDDEVKDGIRHLRMGSRWSVYWRAFRHYRKHLKGNYDLVIDSYFTIPFFAKFYAAEKNVLFVHNLCRRIWFYEMDFPRNVIGYAAEPLYLRLLSDRKAIAMSESTKRDMLRFGHKPENISVISEGIELLPIDSLESVEKFEAPTVLSLGMVRSMKRTDQIVKAFDILKKDVPNARLIIAGLLVGKPGEYVQRLVEQSPYKDSIQILGTVSADMKLELMQKAHVIAVTSVKEGWGLIVTEANSQGTPAAVYDVDGLRDSVKDGVTGMVTRKNTPEALAKNLALMLTDKELYERMRRAAWQWSKEITFDKSYEDFLKAIGA